MHDYYTASARYNAHKKAMKKLGIKETFYPVRVNSFFKYKIEEIAKGE